MCQAERAMATHSSTLVWKIPWLEEPGGLQSMGSRRVGHDWVTSLSLFTIMHWRRKWQPTPVFLPGESRDGRAWWAAVCGLHRVGHDWCNLAAATTCARNYSKGFHVLTLLIFVTARQKHINWAYYPLLLICFNPIIKTINFILRSDSILD